MEYEVTSTRQSDLIAEPYAHMPHKWPSKVYHEEELDEEEPEPSRLSRILQHMTPREVAACLNEAITTDTV